MTGTGIYHITHVNNLSGILGAGGILAKGHVAAGQQLVNSAHESIQTKRAALEVTVGPGGTLHDYVPFYFGYPSPMLYTIHRGNVPGSDGVQENMVYLVSSAQKNVASDLGYAFTDGHAAMAITR